MLHHSNLSLNAMGANIVQGHHRLGRDLRCFGARGAQQPLGVYMGKTAKPEARAQKSGAEGMGRESKRLCFGKTRTRPKQTLHG